MNAKKQGDCAGHPQRGPYQPPYPDYSRLLSDRHGVVPPTFLIVHYVNAEMLVARDIGLKRGKEWSIRNISMTGQRGELLGILGPSGTGKTTLINAIMGRRTEGEVYTSGNVVYVPQEEMLWDLLTPRETLAWAARLAKVEDPVNLGDWGLEGCGDIQVHRLSGGQRRRLSIAVAETSDPSVLLLDEPTSGLDAASARQLMRELVDRGGNRLTLATVHQPSEQLFHTFSSTLLMTHGQPVYFGSGRALYKHLQGFGKECEYGETVPEMALRAVNDEFGGDAGEIEALLGAWRPPPPLQLELRDFAPEKDPEGGIGLLILRTATMQFRDHPRLGIRGAAAGLGGVLLGIVYWGARDHTQRQIFPRVWIVQWIMALPANLAAVTAWATTNELARVQYERNLYSARNWLVARAIIDVGVAGLATVASLIPTAYAIANFNIKQAFPTWVITSLMMWAFDGLAELSGALAGNPMNAVLIFIGWWFNSFLFSGMLVSPDQMPGPLPLMRFISPFFYAGRSIIRMELGSSTWSGARLCPSCPGGFECDADIPRSSCYGYTGKQVLDSLHESFSSVITNDDTFFVDLLGIMAIGVVARLVLLAIQENKDRWCKSD